MHKYWFFGLLPAFLLLPYYHLSGEVRLSHYRSDGTFEIVSDDSLLAQNAVPKTRLRVLVTGYSSTPEETDDTPLITAWGTEARDGVAAANFLAFGTRLRIPEVFGGKVFIIEDRMHPKNDGKLDIWFPVKEDAVRFGIRSAVVEIL